MFRLERQANPLDKLVASAGSSYVQDQLSKREQQRKINELQKLNNLDEQSTPMDRFQAIEGLNLDREEKGKIHQTFDRMDKTSTERKKLDKAKREALEQGSIDEESVNTIEKNFGKNASQIWKASSTGGRTELLKMMLDAKLRGDNVDQLLSGIEDASDRSPEMVDAAAKTAITGEFQYPKVNPFSGLKPNEVPAAREARRKENVPRYEASKTKRDNAEKEERSIGILNNINESGELPEGLGKWVINPSTGEPYSVVSLAGKVNSSTQRWIKTLNDFTTKAKESFPGRVTNFDLQRFMARLPGLLNTPDGRQVILSQMDLTSKIDHLYDDALTKVYRHYGADKITPEQADEIAESMILGEKRGLEEQLAALDTQSDSLYNRTLPEQSEFPDAASSKGRRIKDQDTGELYESDGTTWGPVRNG